MQEQGVGDLVLMGEDTVWASLSPGFEKVK